MIIPNKQACVYAEGVNISDSQLSVKEGKSGPENCIFKKAYKLTQGAKLSIRRKYFLCPLVKQAAL